jgi:signal transduction histidine kinase/regulation of enolase protein 1 (concanavalin A-like superfamily)
VETLDESVAAVVVAADADVAPLLAAAADRTTPPGVVLVDDGEGTTLPAGAGAGVQVTVVAPDEAGTAAERAATAYLDRFERALKADALDTLVADTEASVFLKDDDARYLHLGPQPGGPDPAEAVGKTEREVTGRRVALSAEWTEQDHAVLESGEPLRGETTAADDGVRRFESTKLPWYDDDGDLRGLVGVRRALDDERVHAQQLAERTEQLEQFVEYVTHDLRNPLLVADGYLDLARQGDEEAIEQVGDAIERMDELIEDAKLLAAEDWTEVRTFRQADLQALAEAVWAVIGAPIEGASLQLDVPEGTRIVAAEAELRPVLENLFTNAIDHAGPDVTVRVGTLPDGFFVEDDGPGIPPTERRDVVKRGYTTADDGTGTGLSIVADVVETNEWELVVTDSHLGDGATRPAAAVTFSEAEDPSMIDSEDETDEQTEDEEKPGKSGEGEHQSPGARFEIRKAMVVSDPDAALAATASEDGAELTDSIDVGTVTVPGSAEYDADADRWTVTGEGTNIWRDQDGFQFVSAEVSGPVRIEGRVADIEDVYLYSKAGFMVRNDLEEGAVHGFVGDIADGDIETLWCPSEGADTTSQQTDPPTEGGRLRIDRVGETVTAWIHDGEDWQPFDQRRLPLSDPVRIGLVVCSVTPGTACTATFEDVSVRRLDADEA